MFLCVQPNSKHAEAEVAQRNFTPLEHVREKFYQGMNLLVMRNFSVSN
jgi:hypothetical protein